MYLEYQLKQAKMLGFIKEDLALILSMTSVHYTQL